MSGDTLGWLATSLLFDLPATLAWLSVALAGAFVLRGRLAAAGLFVGGALLHLVSIAVGTVTDVTLFAALDAGALGYEAYGPVSMALGMVQGLGAAIAWALVFAGVFAGRVSPAPAPPPRA